MGSSLLACHAIVSAVGFPVEIDRQTNGEILDIVIDEAPKLNVTDRIVECACRGEDPSAGLREERQTVERAIGNLTRAIEQSGGSLDVLIEPCGRRPRLPLGRPDVARAARSARFSERIA